MGLIPLVPLQPGGWALGEQLEWATFYATAAAGGYMSGKAWKRLDHCLLDTT